MINETLLQFDKETQLFRVNQKELDGIDFIGLAIEKLFNKKHHYIITKNFISEDTAKKIDKEIKRIVDEGYKRAKKILTEKIEDLHKLAKALLIHETLTGDEISDLILKNKTPERKEDQDLIEEEKSSALGTMGLKPKLVH